METIVLCFPVTQEHVAKIAQAADGARVIAAEQNEIAERIFEATIFCGHAKVPVDWPGVVRQCKLKWIQSTAAGLDHCLVPAVVESNIVVSGSSGLFSRQVAEHTLAMLLALVRKLPDFLVAQTVRQYERLPTDELRDKRVGILGFGGNGQRVAEYLRPMCGPIMATDHFAKELSFSGVEIVEPERTPTVLERSDIVICTLPLLESTYLSLGSREFRRMPRGSYFVNMGRGQLVDEQALVEALRSQHLAGAAIDVAFTEPLPATSPLWETKNLIITPHVGAQSKFRVTDTIKLFCDNLTRWKKSQSLLNLVDKQLGFPKLQDRVPIDWPNR
jgi:D-3-phosphoglycerate dehydrogenase